MFRGPNININLKAIYSYFPHNALKINKIFLQNKLGSGTSYSVTGYSIIVQKNTDYKTMFC